MMEPSVANSEPDVSAGVPRLRPSLLRLSVPARLILAAGAALVVWTALLLALA